MSNVLEPVGIQTDDENYISKVSRALSWYNYQKDKKDARVYLKQYLGRERGKIIDTLPESMILCTYGWIARMKLNGCTFRANEDGKLKAYLDMVTAYKVPKSPVVAEVVVDRSNVRDYMEDKIKDYLGELEGVLDDVIYSKTEFDLFRDLKAKSIPALYAQPVSAWIKKKAGEFIAVYETTDTEIKNAYSHMGKRNLTSVIKALSQWLEDIEKYAQYKKANRKPRIKRAKPASVQISKLKYKKEDTTYNLKSVNPVELIGATQAWIFNVRYKKIAVYRTDSREGLQVKGTTLQNYDPEQCEQKSIRKPADILKKILDAGKIQLRKMITDLPSKNTSVTGRINEDCIIVRVIR